MLLLVHAHIYSHAEYTPMGITQLYANDCLCVQVNEYVESINRARAVLRVFIAITIEKRMIKQACNHDWQYENNMCSLTHRYCTRC